VPTTDHDRGIEILPVEDCHRLISTARIGRLGFTRDALPAIQPVPFRLHEHQVIIPARACSEFLPGTRGAVVAFEVDSFDADTRTGWTVTVVGMSRSVTDADGLAALDALPWPHGPLCPDRCYMAITIGLIQGWRAAPEISVAVVARPAS
jgi:uncharacterized protein